NGGFGHRELRAGKWISILQQRVAASRRYNEFAGTSGGNRGPAQPNVQRGREETTSEIPEPVRAPVRDSPAGAGLGLGTAPHLRRAALLSVRRVAALPPRYKPRVRAGFHAGAQLPGDADRHA